MFSNVTMTLLTQSLRENVSKYGSGCNTMFGMMIGSIAKAFRARSHHFHCRQHLMSMIQILPSGSTVVFIYNAHYLKNSITFRKELFINENINI